MLDTFQFNNRKIRVYDHPPTNEDIYRFLRKAYSEDSGGDSKPIFYDPEKLHGRNGEGFSEGAIRRNTWLKLVGEEPEYNYGR